MKKSIITLLMCVLLITPALASSQARLVSMRDASGDLTVNDDPAAVTSTGIFATADILLDITKITTPDADDKICFYFQTTLNLVVWTDVESVCVDNDDNGTTRQVLIIIDGAKDGPGTIQSITGTDPAAGAEISETVPANTIWLVRSISAALVTDASVDDRRNLATLDDGTSVYHRVSAGTDHAASLTVQYTWSTVGADAVGVTAVTDATVNVPLPNQTVLGAGHRFVTVTGLLKAGDNWSAPQISVESWHDPSISTDGTMGDNLKSFDRPVGMAIRVKARIVGATAPTYAYRVSVLLRESR